MSEGRSTRKVITSGQLGKALGLSPRTLVRYAAAGLLVPDLITPGGHFRWVEEDVRRQMRELREQPE